MSGRSNAWRRLAAALAGAALLLLGAPLHQHLGACDAPAPAIEAGAASASGAHAASCPACQTHARSRAGLAPAALEALAPPVATLALAAPGAPERSSDATGAPTPPRGPPPPIA